MFFFRIFSMEKFEHLSFRNFHKNQKQPSLIAKMFIKTTLQTLVVSIIKIDSNQMIKNSKRYFL